MKPGTVPDGGTALRLHARACAGLGGLSAAVHLAMVPAHGWFLGPAMVLMAAACLYCAVRLWCGPDAAEARMMMGSALAMAGLHAALLVAGSGLHTGHTGHTGPTSSTQAGPGGAAASGGADLLLLLAVELTAALAAATLIARLRRQDPVLLT